jgi:ATP-dependent HslUV protease ATP-binding subunit HslU
MSLPIEELTPRQIVAELDKYIVGQAAAKKAVAVALRNRYRRYQLPEAEREDVMPKNILMVGPTGVGKTEIARRVAQLARAPFVKVEATKFTEVGYVGRDVESMIRDLAANAVRIVEKERFDEVRPEAQKRAMDRLIDMLDDGPDPADIPAISEDEDGNTSTIFFDRFVPEDLVKREARREKIRASYQAGEYKDRLVEVDAEESQNPFLQVFTPGGMEEMGLDGNALGGAFGSKIVSRKSYVPEAFELLLDQELKRMVDRSSIHRDALIRAEQTGIIFIDEIDKVAGKSGGSGPDVSREGVQRDLLPVIEGSTVQTKFGPLRTDYILFIAAGAFHISKPSDLIPELQGRLPIRVELEPLNPSDFRRILFEPKNALTKQYISLLAVDGVTISFTEDALGEIASLAAALNERTENIGARRLHTMMERLLEDLLFEAPEIEIKEVVFDAEKVKAKLSSFVTGPSVRTLM